MPVNPPDKVAKFDTVEGRERSREELLDSILARVADAETPRDLKYDWEVYGPEDATRTLNHLDSENFQRFRDALFENLVRLGMDVNSEDDRIAQLVGRFTKPPYSEFGEGERTYHLRNALESVDRLVGAINPDSDSFELLPFEEVTLLSEGRVVIDDMKAFCEGYEYVTRFSTKSSRTVFALGSPFHGTTVRYDAYPETQGLGPNITVSVPTSRIRLSDLMELDPDIAYIRNTERNQDPHYVPAKISAIRIHLGKSGPGKHFTTPSLKGFLADLHEHVEKRE